MNDLIRPLNGKEQLPGREKKGARYKSSRTAELFDNLFAIGRRLKPRRIRPEVPKSMASFVIVTLNSRSIPESATFKTRFNLRILEFMQSNADEQHVLSTAESLDNIFTTDRCRVRKGSESFVRKVWDRRKQ